MSTEADKCPWFADDPLLERYHDEEWGVPCHDDRRLFEYLMLECLSCGLSWRLMLLKRDIFRACFADFDYATVAAFGPAEVESALAYPGMIRSRRKIEAVVSNAQKFLDIIGQFGSFDRYLWAFTDGATLIYRQRLEGEWITRNELSDRIAADLRRRGFRFLGSPLIYSFIQSVGLVNDHEPHCPAYARIGGRIV